MQVKVLQDGKTAVKPTGQVCVISGLILYGQDRTPKFYGWDHRFFKIACPPDTYHDFETLPDGKINLL